MHRARAGFRRISDLLGEPGKKQKRVASHLCQTQHQVQPPVQSRRCQLLKLLYFVRAVDVCFMRWYVLRAWLAGRRSTNSRLRKGRSAVCFATRGGIYKKLTKAGAGVKGSSVKMHGTRLWVSTSDLCQGKQIFQRNQPSAPLQRKGPKPQVNEPKYAQNRDKKQREELLPHSTAQR